MLSVWLPLGTSEELRKDPDSNGLKAALFKRERASEHPSSVEAGGGIRRAMND